MIGCIDYVIHSDFKSLKVKEESAQKNTKGRRRFVSCKLRERIAKEEVMFIIMESWVADSLLRLFCVGGIVYSYWYFVEIERGTILGRRCDYRARFQTRTLGRFGSEVLIFQPMLTFWISYFGCPKVYCNDFVACCVVQEIFGKDWCVVYYLRVFCSKLNLSLYRKL